VGAPPVSVLSPRATRRIPGWGRVIPSRTGAYEVITAVRGIDCRGAPSACAWPGWASPEQALYTAELLLGLDQWALGVVMLRRAGPDDQILCTSYQPWNDFYYAWNNDFISHEMNRDEQPPAMDFRGVLLSSPTACRRRSRRSGHGGYAGPGR
jgi:hypothetical protein